MFADRVIETLAVGFTGVGTYNLGGAQTNARSFASQPALAAGAFYVARLSLSGAAGWGKWEKGFGIPTAGAPDTLTRTVLESFDGATYSTSAKINWQAGDGTIVIYTAPVAEVSRYILTDYRGTTAPPWAQNGTRWLDTTGGVTSVVWKRYDGADWITLGTFNETANTFVPSGVVPSLPLAGGTMTGAMLVPAGTSGAPSIARSNNTDTGLGFDTADEVCVVINATKRVNVTAAGAVITGALDVTGNVTTGGIIYPGNQLAFQLDYNGGNPAVRMGHTGNTYFYYNSGSSYFEWAINTASKLILSTTTLNTQAVTINAGNIALQSGASLSHATGGNTVVDTNGNHVLRQYANVAALPSAASNSGRIVQCLSTTTPGLGALPVTSDGANWRDGTGGTVN